MFFSVFLPSFTRKCSPLQNHSLGHPIRRNKYSFSMPRAIRLKKKGKRERMEKVEEGNTRIKDYVKEEPKEGKKIDENRRLCNKKNGDQVQQQVTEDGKEYFHWKGLPPLLMNLQVGDKGP